MDHKIKIKSPELEDSINGNPIEFFDEVSGSLDKIKIDKVIYSNGSINKVIDRSFSELISEDPTIDVEGFFKQYNQLFYDIPKEGSPTSHFTLIEQSTDYLQGFNNPKDAQIESLLNRIEELELQLSEGEEIEQSEGVEENLNFPNGSFVAGPSGIYVMDRGRKRALAGGHVWRTFKSIRKSTNINDEDIYVKPGDLVMSQIPNGPLFTAESFTNSDQEWDDFLGQVKFNQELSDKIKELDPDGFHAGLVDPYRFNTDNEFIEALEKEINELENVHTHLKSAPDQDNQNVIEKIHANRVIYDMLRDVYVLALEGGRAAIASQAPEIVGESDDGPSRD